jgi:hypothetical protein
VSKNIVKVYLSTYRLRKRRSNIINKLNLLEKNKEDLALKYAHIESSLVQDTGYSQYEIKIQKEKLFKDESIISDEEYKLKSLLDEIDKKIKKMKLA